MTRPPMWRAASWRRRRTERACRYRWCTVAIRRSTGARRCLLYGYGSYGVTVPAAFNTNILSLIDRGFIYAIAHVRGGKDKGYRWYRDGQAPAEDATPSPTSSPWPGI